MAHAKQKATRRSLSSAALTLQPFNVSGNLPKWNPTAPPGGWAPAEAWAAATEYAEEHEATGLSEHRLARAAFRELCRVVPSLHRAWMIERLHGLDATQHAPGDALAIYADF